MAFRGSPVTLRCHAPTVRRPVDASRSRSEAGGFAVCLAVLQAGSAPASAGILGLLAVVTAYLFVNTAFGIGPIHVGAWVRRRFSPLISRRLRRWLEPD